MPTIPIPRSPAYIIPTSFPPSPIAATSFPVYFLIPSATYAFYVGKHLQQITLGAFEAVSKNNFWCLSSNIIRQVPSISRTVFNLLLYCNNLLCNSNSSVILVIS